MATATDADMAADMATNADMAADMATDTAPTDPARAASLAIALEDMEGAAPPREVSPQQVAVENAITQLLQETASDAEAFAHLRDVCLRTLTLQHAGTDSGVNGGAAMSDMPPSLRRQFSSPPQALLAPRKAMTPRAGGEGAKSWLLRRGDDAHSTNNKANGRSTAMDTSPIFELTAVFSSEPVPDGFTKVDRSPSGQRADLSKGGGGVFIYLCVSRDASCGKLPIGDVLVIFPDRGEFAPTDYEIVQRRGAPVNFNSGTQGEKVLLCCKRSAAASIVDVTVLFPKKGDKLPYGFSKIDRTPDGHHADINSGTGGTEVILSYKKDIHCIAGLQQQWQQLDMSMRAERQEIGASKQRTPKKQSGSPKADEVRLSRTLSSPSSPRRLSGAMTITTSDTGQSSIQHFVYPLLLACFTRHGIAADTAIQGLSMCVEADVFERTSDLQLAVTAVASVCNQGVKSRFAVVLPFLRKIIRRYSTGFEPTILHMILKCLVFIGDFDVSLIKSVEDELVYKTMSLFEIDCTEREINKNRQNRGDTSHTPNNIAQQIVSHLIDDTIEGIEIAKWTEHVLGVTKSHPSIHSPAFCSDLIELMDSFLSSTAEKNAHHIVLAFCKSMDSRKCQQINDQNAARQSLALVNALRAMNATLMAAGERTKLHRGFGQVVRRFVFSSLSSVVVIWSPDVFGAALTLISTLWNHYRRHLKIEFALLFEHLFLRLLRSNCPGAANRQLDIMDGITPWLQLPHALVEMFVNFDLDTVQQWRIFEHLCSALCSIAEGNSAHQPGNDDDPALRLQVQAISTVAAIARSIMDASGHAHLISRDSKTRMLSMEHGGWQQDERAEEECPVELDAIQSMQPQVAVERAGVRPKNVRASVCGARGTLFGNLSVRMRNELQKRDQQLLKRAMEIASSKSLKKAIEFLVAMNFVQDTPREISSFLRIYHDFFDEVEIGDYLGTGDEDFQVQVRLTYVRAMSFKGMPLVESLRHFLTNGGFRLPGEAQKIERMVEAFAQCFFEDSPNAFASADTAMIIAYSIIMLNTDLHNPQVKNNKMSKDQFVRNNRGIDNGRDLPRKMLEEIYDGIARHPMALQGSRVAPTSSNEASPTSLVDAELEKLRTSVMRAITQSEELMKDLSASSLTFNFVGVDTCISPDLIKVLFERVWFYLLALATSILCDAQSDLSLTMHCLDLLRFNISTCLFLDMPVERRAFCSLLTKVHNALEDSKSERETDDEEEKRFGDNEDMDDMMSPTTDASLAWMASIESAVSSDDPWRVMGDIHMLVNKMKESIQRRQRSEELHSVIRRINRAHVYLRETTRFIREGDLTKQCRSRTQTYRFFLFNDQLLYADKGIGGNWNPHKSLRLKLTRISDVADNAFHKHAFQVINPLKSFVVYADSADAKTEWMRLIEDAIRHATNKVARNARRLSRHTLTRPLPSTFAATAASTASLAMKQIMRRTSRISSPHANRQRGSVTPSRGFALRWSSEVDSPRASKEGISAPGSVARMQQQAASSSRSSSQHSSHESCSSSGGSSEAELAPIAISIPDPDKRESEQAMTKTS